MKRINYSDQRRKAATALRTLGCILSRHGICSDVSPLSGAADQCADQTRGRPQYWGYDVPQLVFKMDAPKGTIPNRPKDFRIELSISVAGNFDSDQDDQFTQLSVDIEKYALSHEGLELKAAWHFDRHVINTKTDSPLTTDDIHPLYHFQYGGARMSKFYDRLGNTLMLDPPRLMHPPMDGILAVDFVLANYAGKKWKTLRDDTQYMNLITPYFEKLWKPYFSAIAASWSKPRIGNSSFLCPFV